MPEHDKVEKLRFPSLIRPKRAQMRALRKHKMSLAVAVIFSIISLQCLESIAIEPSEHSPVHDDHGAAAISPAMVAFFGRNRAPVANNSTTPKWALPSPRLHQQKVNGWVRTMFLVACVVSVVVGFGSLVGLVLALVVRFRERPKEIQVVHQG